MKKKAQFQNPIFLFLFSSIGRGGGGGGGGGTKKGDSLAKIRGSLKICYAMLAL